MFNSLFYGNDKSILVKNVTEKMETWLAENFEEDKYVISPNKVCVKHVLVPRPGHENEYETRGYYICFEDTEDAVAFKLYWADEIEKQGEITNP